MIISTPAKIILSGEHSVIYGAPAIGAPLSLFLYSRWSELPEKDIFLRIEGHAPQAETTWAALPEKLAVYRARYAAFRQDRAEIREVLPGPLDLVLLTFAVFQEKTGVELPGLSVSLETQIPVSSGLGSSSSLIYNLLRGLLRFAKIKMPMPELLALARDIEDFQHGISSGIDLALVSAKQPLVFLKDKGVVESMPPIPSGIVLVQTGKPSVSTGQCVARVRENFAQDDGLWCDFAACTRGIQTAFALDDFAALGQGIAQNQKLLERIGVVPDKVQNFINDCGKAGIAAKVCGAGAISGDGAGMVWALADNDDTIAALDKTAKDYGYTHGLYSVAS